jgi:2,4-dienoyl-CoA reductase-like NADH-dependent reductase (Old Yellow Enzyme family)/thioredoxin reductase
MIERAFAPLLIGPAEAPNRLALAPVKTALGGTDGLASQRHVEYYRRRAVGGAGLIIVEPLYVNPLGKEHPRQLGAHSDEVVPGLREITEAIHCSGSVAFAHLNHAGRAANPKAIGGAPEAPSAVVCPSTGATSAAMSSDRITEVLDAYAEAAKRVSEAGFDGIELQLGLGYLPAQFLSPRTNQRDDDYGGDEQRRWRFVRELVETVRRTAGRSMALIARLSADEKVKGGLGLTDAVELARRLEAWGIDGIHVVTGSACDNPPWYYQHMALPSGANETLAAAVKREVDIPVLVAGRLGDPERIRAVLGQGMADMVALGRPLVADPDLPRKMALGRENEIMSCGSCLQGCLAQVKGGGPIGCIINPEVGHESEELPTASATGQYLVVVGGGPAGMQAALTARRQGHTVTLFERRPTLGGLFALAPATPGKQAMERPLRSLVSAVERTDIDLRTDIEATAETILDLKPDRVILATGSEPLLPPVPGLDDPLTAEDLLTGRRQPGQRVLVLGGGLVGIEMAEMLAEQGHTVVVVEMLDEIARDMEAVTRKMTLRRLQELPVEIHTSTRLTRLEEGVAFVEAEGSDDETSLGTFDSVLVAVGHRPYDPLSRTLEEAGVSATVVGDAARPGQILDATRGGLAALIEETGTELP